LPSLNASKEWPRSEFRYDYGKQSWQAAEPAPDWLSPIVD